MSDGVVYAITNDCGLVKIGSTNDIKGRLSMLRCGDTSLKVIYTSKEISNRVDVEKLCHKDVDKFRTGGEWFNIPKDKAINLIESKAMMFGKAAKGFDHDLFNEKLANANAIATGFLSSSMAKELNGQLLIFKYTEILSSCSNDAYRNLYLKKSEGDKYLIAANFFINTIIKFDRI